jgi:hypothetical protein
MQEAIPMVVGFQLPGYGIHAVKLSDVGYKSALQEGLTTGRIDYYAKQPVSKPLELAKIDYKAYAQENPGTTLKDYLSYRAKKPASELMARVDTGIEKLVHPSRFAGVEGTENIWQPKSTQNIWGKQIPTVTTKLSTSAKTPKPSGDVEIRASNGMVQVSRAELKTAIPEQLPMVRTGVRGLPEYPSGPSPLLKNMYRIEEETEYFTLPPGMKRPGQNQERKQETTQVLMPMTGVMSGLVGATALKAAASAIKSSSSGVAQVPTYAQEVRTDLGWLPAFGTKQTPFQSTTQNTIQRQGRIQVTEQGRINIQGTDQVTRQIIDQMHGNDLPQKQIVIPKFDFGGFGGGAVGSWGKQPRGFRFTETFGMLTKKVANPFAMPRAPAKAPAKRKKRAPSKRRR